MNPLPNRPLLNNTTLPLQLPNVPSFDQMAFNGRPRKVMPEVGKDFPLLNGINNMMGGPSSAPATSGPQVNPMDRAVPNMTSQQQAQPSGSSSGQQQQGQQPLQLFAQPESKEREGEHEPPLTSMFRPDESRHDNANLNVDQVRFDKPASAQPGMPLSGPSGWEQRGEDEEGKEEDGDVEDDDGSVISEGDEAKHWKAKRTLRKLV